MKKSHGLLAAVVVVGYFGLEIYNLFGLRYRTEPLYIFDEFASARVASELCGAPSEAVQRNFERNFLHVTRRAENDAAEQLPPNSSDSATELTQQRLEATRHSIESTVASNGCEAPEIRRFVKLYEVRSRLKLRAPAGTAENASASPVQAS